MKSTFAIVGGGIGGISTAIALQKLGFDVRIYERHYESSEIGSGINLGGNALTSLDYLGVGEEVRRAGRSENNCRILSDKGKTLTILNDDGTLQLDYTFLLRSELINILSKKILPNTILFNKKLKDFIHDDKQVTLYFEDGTTASAEYLIASDGIFSEVRKKLLPGSRIRFAGYACWRGVIENCPDYFEKKFTETWGPRGRFGIIPLQRDSFYWYALKNCREDDSQLENWNIEDIMYNFISYHAPIPALIERTGQSRINFRKVYDLEPIKQYAFNRILLLGDAAHATTPNMGQGACQAIEDALYLLLSLKENPDIRKAFTLFQDHRRQRAKTVIQDSWMLGKMAQIEIPLLCSIRNKMIELAPNKIHDKKLREVFEISSTL